MAVKRVTAKHLTHREIRDYRDSVAWSDHIAMYERLMCDTAIGAFALGSTKKAIDAARRHVAAAINARRAAEVEQCSRCGRQCSPTCCATPPLREGSK